MRLLICALILLTACAEADKTQQQKSVIQLAGYLESKSLRETSGLARSNVRDDVIWAINDDGPADLYAVGVSGEKRGKIRIPEAKNRDWEDLASFVLDDVAYLLVADIGDNDGKRNDVTLYVVEEPDPDADEATLAWEIEFTYPEGPRDAEALTVDAGTEQILVLSKRDIPAQLYSLPLRSAGDDRVIAEYLGMLHALPQPTRRDVKNARTLNNWHWQPTAMDISPTGNGAVILTYHGIYYFARQGDEDWMDAFARSPLGASLGKYRNAESIAFDREGSNAFVTTEKKHAPLLRIDLRSAIDR